MASQLRTASVLPISVHDQATPTDELGFAPYVLALSRFLTNQYTVPPLAVSIEGDWGSGKSSFMMQVEKQIVHMERLQHEYLSSKVGRSRRKPGYKRREPLTVWFNAWRHAKTGEVSRAVTVAEHPLPIALGRGCSGLA